LTAALGLSVAARWGRLLATVVCAMWVLTCVGIPLAIACLVAVWSPSKR
jgi:hypothetical protein